MRRNNQNNYSRRGRRTFGGRRNNNNINVFIQDKERKDAQNKALLNKEEIVKMVQEAVHKEIVQSTPTKANEINCSDFSWEDFEEEFQKVEDKMELGELVAFETDYDQTVYTDAWDGQKFFEFALHYWDAQNVERNDFRRDNSDILLFACYVAATAELFLYAQDDVIGVNGITLEQVRQAQYKLKGMRIPQLIGDMLLGLRPIVIAESRIKLVLLPHTAVDRYQQPIPDDHIDVGNRINLMMRDPILLIKPRFGNVGQPVALPGVFIGNWMASVVDFLVGRFPGHYQPEDLEQIVGRRFWMKQYAQAQMMVALANVAIIPYTMYWFDFWFRSTVSDQLDKWVQVYFIGFGNQFMYQPRFKGHVPILIDNILTDTYEWTEESSREKWIPWFTFMNIQGARVFRQIFNQQMPELVINPLLDRNRSLLTYNQWARKLSLLCYGNSRALGD